LLEAGGQAAPSDRPTDEAAAYVSVGEAAKFFGVTSQTIRNWADKGLLAADVTPAGTRLIPAVALQRARAFLDAPRPGPRFSEAEIAQIVEHMRD
jgi:DNA-binding transcriptional MerR regulator